MYFSFPSTPISFNLSYYIHLYQNICMFPFHLPLFPSICPFTFISEYRYVSFPSTPISFNLSFYLIILHFIYNRLFVIFFCYCPYINQTIGLYCFHNIFIYIQYKSLYCIYIDMKENWLPRLLINLEI